MNDIGDELNLTLLHQACLMNNSDKVAKLLQDKTVDISATDENNSTPLHCACQAGHTEIVELLIKERANRLTSSLHENDADSKIKSFFNLTDNHKNIPLGLACIEGHTEIVELLLEQEGVDINHINSQKRTPLAMACIRGHTKIVELLLKKGANANVTDENELTPLGNASIPGHTEIVKLLLEHGANVNVTDKNGNTPLGNASIPGHTKIVELLLEHGVDNVDHTDKDDDTPLGMACVGEHKEVVALLLEHGANINHTNKQKRTPLVMTCIAGNTEIVALLLEHKADVNKTDEGNNAPLGIACHQGHAEIVGLLLVFGADVTHKNKKGCTPLAMACIGGHAEIVELLLNQDGVDINVTDGLKNTPLGNACLRGHTQIAELLLKYGVADINNTNIQKRTALGMACIEGYTEVVKLLLKYKANVNVTDNNGLTPLCNASIPGHTEIVKLLLEHGVANVDHPDKDDDTPLGLACMRGKKEVIELLLKHGANINHINKQKHTPLVLACIAGHAEIVELLKKNGRVDINVTDERKNSPLVVACIGGQKEVVEKLLKMGAKVNATDEQNRVPLCIACEQGHTEVVKLLLEHKAKVNVTDNNGNTPLDLACVKGHTEIVKLLLKHGIDNAKNTYDENCIVLRMAGAGGQLEGVNIINHTNRENGTPLQIVCIKGYTEIVELLLKHGADVNVTDKDDRTPLHIACMKQHKEIIKLLLKKEDVDLNVADKDNSHTPLLFACKEGYTEIVELLLEHNGVHVNATDKDNHTALQIAYIQQHTEIVKLLLEHKGVDVNVTDKDSHTPLLLACKEGYTEIVELLLEHNGVHVNATDKDNHTALQIAYIQQHTEIVKLLLEHKGVDVNVTDKDSHYTALQIACEKGHTEIVELLLKRKDTDVTKCNKDGLNALDIAVERGKKDAAMAIVTSDKWEDALRNYTVKDTIIDESADEICGIRRVWCCKKRKNHGAKKQFTTPMRRIIKKMPDVAKVVFDNCCKKENPEDHPDHEITFNYEFLDDFDLNKRTSNERTTKKWPPQLKYSSENHCLNILADSPSADLLKHPLAVTLLDQKWNKIGCIVYYTNLFFYFLFVILLTSYALTVHPPNSKICMEVFGNDNETSIDCFTEERFVSRIYISIASTCLIVYCAIMIIREAFQLVLFKEEYLTSFVNFIEVPLFVFTIIFASVHSNQCYCTHSWQWQTGVIAVFLCWIALIFSIRKLPVVGIYVVMFIKIFNNFMKVVTLALLLILAFAVPFYMMFYDPQDRAEGIRTPFITPWRTTVKAITMTVGELDMDPLLRQNNQMNAPDVQYPVVSFSLIIVFVILMPILFLNLLIGLAVGDTDEIQKSADTYRLTLKVEFTLPIEELLRSIKNHLDKKEQLKKVSYLLEKIVTITKMKDKPNKHSFFKRTIDEIEKSKTEHPATVADVKNQSKSLSEEMKDLRSSMAQLLATVNSMNERQGGGGGGTGRGGAGGRLRTGGLEEEVEQQK
ncbi:PREDICTED: ankyrin repeat domain-containing protein 17-like isoform X2 [Amphimedon queenslandica]|nr:PREDICTED: ankyrin repeat domain-containing protein 17-like isoform X2 [Amphimedon queenslandica]|eukprot:XP_019854452.1 PREDICTED: ankyrin repeat domain-containing protein 17-like isoform X2 [Amphimedon queenslandica]